MGRLADEMQIVTAFVPVDSQTAAITGDYVSMKNYGHLTIVLNNAIGIAGDDLVVTLDQAKTVAGGSAKALNISEVFYKVGATAISAVGTFTKATQTAADGYDTAAIDGAENEMLLVIEVSKDDLDTDNDFDCVSVAIADTGSAGAQLLSGMYILTDPRFDAVEAIAD
jgi:hypothetical protein